MIAVLKVVDGWQYGTVDIRALLLLAGLGYALGSDPRVAVASCGGTLLKVRKFFDRLY